MTLPNATRDADEPIALMACSCLEKLQ
jgi:hypothetical protein